jgi:hypothetical protein
VDQQVEILRLVRSGMIGKRPAAARADEFVMLSEIVGDEKDVRSVNDDAANSLFAAVFE